MDLTAYIAIKNAEKEKGKMKENEFCRGDIFTTIKADQTEGCPCVIVSNDEINGTNACVMVVYLSDNKELKHETEVIINAKGQRVAECKRVYTLHKSRLCEYIRTCTDVEIINIDLALMRAFGIQQAADLEDPEEKPEAEAVKNLKMMLEEATRRCKQMKKELDAADAKLKIISEDLTKTQVQRDLYRQLYDETLDKLLVGYGVND